MRADAVRVEKAEKKVLKDMKWNSSRALRAISSPRTAIITSATIFQT